MESLLSIFLKPFLCLAPASRAWYDGTDTKPGRCTIERIFLSEDDEALGRGIALALQTPDRAVAQAATLAQARALLQGQDFALLIPDVNLPDGSGLDLVRDLRAAGHRVPILLLTANDLELDEVTGLEAGADDYITKPFSLAVLRARVGALLRRGAAPAAEIFVQGPLRLDFARLEFRRDGAVVELSKTEQKLLRVLVENRGHTVPRATLVDRVWTDGADYVEENALSVTVRRLRSKLEADPAAPRYLKTVYGIGYRWEVTP